LIFPLIEFDVSNFGHVLSDEIVELCLTIDRVLTMPGKIYYADAFYLVIVISLFLGGSMLIAGRYKIILMQK
jgi:hypothetical protein